MRVMSDSVATATGGIPPPPVPKKAAGAVAPDAAGSLRADEFLMQVVDVPPLDAPMRLQVWDIVVSVSALPLGSTVCFGRFPSSSSVSVALGSGGGPVVRLGDLGVAAGAGGRPKCRSTAGSQPGNQLRARGGRQRAYAWVTISTNLGLAAFPVGSSPAAAADAVPDAADGGLGVLHAAPPRSSAATRRPP